MSFKWEASFLDSDVTGDTTHFVEIKGKRYWASSARAIADLHNDSIQAALEWISSVPHQNPDCNLGSNPECLCGKEQLLCDLEFPSVKDKQLKAAREFVDSLPAALALRDVQQGQWIEVKEQLPEPRDDGRAKTQYVLIRTEDADHFIAFYDFKRKCWDDGDYQDCIAEVSHWMKIPALAARQVPVGPEEEKC